MFTHKTNIQFFVYAASDKQGVNLQILTTLVRKAELSRSEVQILIDMLLNKQHEAPSVIDEWSEVTQSINIYKNVVFYFFLTSGQS